MSIYTPYFYIIQEVSTKKYYAGSRWAKGCNPQELLKTNGYITSSKKIKNLIRENGLESFIIVKIRAFSNKKEVHAYETRFLRKVDAKNNESFYNRHNNDCYLRFEDLDVYISEKYGDGITNISQTDYWKESVPQKLRKPKSNKARENMIAASKRPETIELRRKAMTKQRALQTPERRTEIGILGGSGNKGKKKSNKHRNSIASALRKVYIINELIIVENAKDFCMENGLNYINFTQAAKYKKCYKGLVIEVIL